LYDRPVRGTHGLVGVLAAVLILLGASEGADAAVLKASYLFQGNLASETGGAPELTALGAGSRFRLETVDGTRRPVLAFPRGGGLSLATGGLVDSRNHSVVMLFRLAEVSRYRRLLDFTNGSSDNGLYNLDGRVVLYLRENSAISPGVVFDDSYVQVVLTNVADLGDSQKTTVYVNGAAAVTARSSSEGLDLGSGVLRFFKDNASGVGAGEESAGSIACVLVYDGALTADEVGEVAGNPGPCSAPRSVPERAKVLKTGKPEARSLGRSIVVDTGLSVSCPVGTTSCLARGRVDIASRQAHALATKVRRLGAVRFSIPAGTSRAVLVPLSARGGRALRRAGELKVSASAAIAVAGSRGAAARQTGRIEAPRAPAFKAGTYTGTTSQGLPIFLTAGRTAVKSIYFRWRVRCADGQTHTNAILVRGARVRRGRFSFSRTLDTGGSVIVTGRIGGVHAAGTLSRMGTSAFETECKAKRIRWHARASGVEVGES
jgi:Concanavalin A-like lectin/glucanases superfamily